MCDAHSIRGSIHFDVQVGYRINSCERAVQYDEVAITLSLLSTMALAGTANDARAQGYPKRPISYIVPYGPGSGNDVIARIVARKVSDSLGQPVVVVNRP